MPTHPPISVDLAETRRRIAKLGRYVEENLLRRGKFVCCHFVDCAASRRPGDVFEEGTMSHVGRRYDSFRGDKPVRVVVVGQEAASRRVTLEDRYKQVHDVTGLRRRYYAEPGFRARNPHMRGTTQALRAVFGLGLGEDFGGEFVHPVDGKPFHVFDGFALVNRLLCFAGPPSSAQGRATSRMYSNCSDHFAATISILEPTIVILQGRDVTRWTKNVLTPTRVYGEHLYEARLGQQRMVVCTFSHPSARGLLRWGDRVGAPYLNEIVAPTLREAVRRS
jgi:hypothetical protein